VEPSSEAQPNRRNRRRRRTDVESVEVPTAPGDFDPNHPFAFRPPEYDELSINVSEPPKYDDIEETMTSSRDSNADGSATNAAFEPDEGPPPDLELQPFHSVSRNRQSTSETGNERVIRIDVSATATADDSSTPPPAYEDAVVSVPMSTLGAAA
jgi:hypothetical protein